MKISAAIFACALIASSASYAQTAAPTSGGSPAAATTSGSSSGGAHHPGPCHDDVQKFCSNVQKGGGRVLACLKEHEAQLSPRCEAGMKKHASSGQQGTPAQGMQAPAPSTGTSPVK